MFRIATLFTLAIAFTPALQAGGLVTNGGDLVVCGPNDTLFALDFFAEEPRTDADYLAAATSDEYTALITARIAATDPVLAADYESFMKIYGKWKGDTTWAAGS